VEVVTFIEKAKVIINYMFDIAKAEKELFLLIWAQENYRLLMCFSFSSPRVIAGENVEIEGEFRK
jgi:hypothetical protein